MKISVVVKPGSKKGPLVEKTGDQLIVFVRERAVDGQANKVVNELLAKHFGVAKSHIEIVSGHSSKHKIVSIEQ